MTREDRARAAVIEAWLDAGFDPKLYGPSFDAVRAGEWDHMLPVQIALKASETNHD